MAGMMYIPPKTNPFIGMGANFLSNLAMAGIARDWRKEDAEADRAIKAKEREEETQIQMAKEGFVEVPPGVQRTVGMDLAGQPEGSFKAAGKYYKRQDKPNEIIDVGGGNKVAVVYKNGKVWAMPFYGNKGKEPEKWEEMEPEVVGGKTIFKQKNVTTGEIKRTQVAPVKASGGGAASAKPTSWQRKRRIKDEGGQPIVEEYDYNPKTREEKVVTTYKGVKAFNLLQSLLGGEGGAPQPAVPPPPPGVDPADWAFYLKNSAQQGQ